MFVRTYVCPDKHFPIVLVRTHVCPDKHFPMAYCVSLPEGRAKAPEGGRFASFVKYKTKEKL